VRSGAAKGSGRIPARSGLDPGPIVFRSHFAALHRPVDGEQRPGEIAAGPENPREAKPRRIPAPSDAEPDQALT
jgi:hypothetical protein